MPTIHPDQTSDSSLHLRMPRLGGFTLLEPLAEGTCGIVYKARQDRLGRLVALKLLPEWPPPSDVTLERFNRAACVTAQVVHSNLIPLHDFGTADGYHYASMELICGQSLQKHLANSGPVDELFALRLGEQILQALAALHGRDICHRNIKPKNILVEGNGTIRLVGLGLASCKSAFFSPHLDARPIGTPHFMAPEMIRGQFADPRSDLYSLGVTLYVATTGRTPFEKGSPMAVMSRHLTEAPCSLADARPGMSLEFCGFVDTLMAREPEQRFQSAKAALDICSALLKRHDSKTPQAKISSSRLPLPMPRRTGALRRASSHLLAHPLLIGLSAATFTLGLLACLMLAIPALRDNWSRPVSNDADLKDLNTLLERDALEFKKTPMRGAEAWNAYLQSHIDAPLERRRFARERLAHYLEQVKHTREMTGRLKQDEDPPKQEHRPLRVQPERFQPVEDAQF